MNSLNRPVDISPNHLDAVLDILRKHLPAGVKVWVFGSRADWTTRDSSDLDLALDGDSVLDYDTIMALEMAFEESSLPYMVDVVDLNRVGCGFKRIVDAQKTPLDDTSTLPVDQWPIIQFGNCAELVRDTVLPEDLDNIPYIGLEHIGEGTLSLTGCGNASDASSTKGRFRRG